MTRFFVCPKCGMVKKHETWVRVEAPFSDFYVIMTLQGVGEVELEPRLCPRCSKPSKPVG